MGPPERHVRSEFELIDRQGNRVSVRIEAATEAHLLEHEEAWRPALRASGQLDAEWTWHMDFVTEERSSPDRETYALASDARLEGPMSLLFHEDHVYVERLAVAPQNRPSGGRNLKGVGAALAVHAIRRSMDTGRAGRLVLHSLEDPATLGFYRAKLNMIETGSDVVDGENMRRFELSPDVASEILRGGQQTP